MQNPSNKIPKVMHVVADMLPGGAEVLMANLIRHQEDKHTCENVVVTLEDHGEENSLRPQIEESARFYNLECQSFFSKEFRSKFKDLLAKEKPDVVHTWGYDSGLAAGLIAKFNFGIKVAWAIHSLDLPSRHEYGALKFALLKTLVGIGSRVIPHRIISCSDVASDSHVRFGYPRKRCVTIPNGIDTNRFKPDASADKQLRDTLGIPEETPIIGYLGRSHPVKCLEDYFEAANILMQKYPEWHFVALGFSLGELYPDARLAYEKLENSARMHVLGSCSDVEKYLPAFTVNVLTSKSEAMPMVLMEALCCGVPCVTSDVGAARDVVGTVGQCVPARKPEALADAVGQMVTQIQQDSDAWSERARQRGIKHFSLEQAEHKYTQLYAELAGIVSDHETSDPRVLHLVNDLDFGGAQTILHRLAKGLSQKGFEQTVVSVLPPGRLAPGFSASGIPVKTLGIKGIFSGITGVFRMAKMIRKENPDIIQTWMFHSALIGKLAAFLSFRQAKVLWSIHHTKLGKESSKWTTRIIQRTLAFLSSFTPEKIIYCSQASVDLHLEDGFASSKTELIFNGTDVSFYQANDEVKKTIREEYEIPLDAPLIGMAGRYHPQKDFANLLRAFALVQKDIPEAHLIACGPDVTRETDALRELADCCPSPEQVHLIGPRLDMQDVYPAFSIAALSSCEGEAFPLVLGEAMSCEVPCVATNVGDSALIIGDTGKIVEPRDSEALACAMIELLGENLEVFGEKARQRVIDNFTLERYVQSHANLYRSISLPNKKVISSGMADSVNKQPQPVSH